MPNENDLKDKWNNWNMWKNAKSGGAFIIGCRWNFISLWIQHTLQENSLYYHQIYHQKFGGKKNSPNFHHFLTDLNIPWIIREKFATKEFGQKTVENLRPISHRKKTIWFSVENPSLIGRNFLKFQKLISLAIAVYTRFQIGGKSVKKWWKIGGKFFGFMYKSNFWAHHT